MIWLIWLIWLILAEWLTKVGACALSLSLYLVSDLGKLQVNILTKPRVSCSS